DAVIGDRVAEALLSLGPIGAWSVIVVSDDREVRDHARRNGARVEGTAWLAARLAAPTGTAVRRAGTSLGQGRPPSARRQQDVPDACHDVASLLFFPPDPLQHMQECSRDGPPPSRLPPPAHARTPRPPAPRRRRIHRLSPPPAGLRLPRRAGEAGPAD